MSFTDQSLIAILLFLTVVNCCASAYNTKPSISSTKRHLYKRDIWTGFRMLLKGAKMVKNSEYLRLYYKRGGYQKALEDFHILKPSNVEELPNGGRLGEIGDIPISLIIDNGQPRLTIPAGLNRVFVYTDFKNNKLH